MQRAAASVDGNANTAPTSVPSSSTAIDATGCCCATSVASGPPRLPLTLFGVQSHQAQCRPARVNILMVVVDRRVIEPGPAGRAQARAVVVTDRPQRQREHDRVAQLRFEVDEISHEPTDLVVIGLM